MPPGERRRHGRFACNLGASIELGGGDPAASRAVDLSAGGICIESERQVAPGTRALFHIRLIMGWAESETLSLPGHVVWCTPTQGKYQLGARFEGLDDRARERIGVVLGFLQGDLELLVDPEGRGGPGT